MKLIRLKQARLMAGLTQKDAVARLSGKGIKLTSAAISKYEQGKGSPSLRILNALCAVYRVTPSFILSKPSVTVEWLSFRQRTSLSAGHRKAIQSRASLYLEEYYSLREMFDLNSRPVFTSKYSVMNLEDAESAAAALRSEWHLGSAPIPSVTDLFESKGGMIVEFDTVDGFDGLSGTVNDEFPAIVIRRDLSADRKRFNIAHEIAHDYTGTDDEKLAHRFAAAFLLPSETVFSEIGAKRRKLNLTELLELKKKHGVSIQAWVRRAYDLGVITWESYQSTCRWISSKGWRRNEPGEYCFPEEPIRFRQLVLRALSEGMITNAWASHLLPDMEYTPTDTQLSRLMKMSDQERAEALSPILDRAAEDYLKSEDLTDLHIAEEPDDYE